MTGRAINQEGLHLEDGEREGEREEARERGEEGGRGREGTRGERGKSKEGHVLWQTLN